MSLNKNIGRFGVNKKGKKKGEKKKKQEIREYLLNPNSQQLKVGQFASGQKYGLYRLGVC